MRENLDFKQHVDCIALIGRDVPLVYDSSTQGGEYHGPCPFCGGKDRLIVQSQRWLCRRCQPHWEDSIAYVMRRDGTGFKEACQTLREWVGMPTDTPSDAPHLFLSVRPLAPKEASASECATPTPPDAEWQAHMCRLVTDAAYNLIANDLFGFRQRARDYLHQRGLTDATIDRAQLGYLERSLTGISIPIFQSGSLWAVKVRLLDNPDRRYQLIKGSRLGALYGADAMRGLRNLAVVEGEFDQMLLSQEVGAMCDVVTPGSADVSLNPDWLPHIARAKNIVLAFDRDPAGAEATERWATWLAGQGKAVRVALPPCGKDVTDSYQAGADLAAWLAGFCI